MKADLSSYLLHFKQPSGTSRGVLTQKKCWFIKIYEEDNPASYGIGEIAPLKGLSMDDRPDFEDNLKEVCLRIDEHLSMTSEGLKDFPSIRFGLEMAMKDLAGKGSRMLFPSDFTKGLSPILINGLIWMGSEAFMRQQIDAKVKAGFRCIKMKIGAIDFETELNLLKYIRQQYSNEEIELRVDANGAFSASEAMEKLRRLSELNIHSIEQPVRQGQWELMADLCRSTPLPIALDEELIGINDPEKKRELLEFIRPQYIILKPTLLGGFAASREWIDLAEANKTGWWITSALESNIGLNAIAQWTYTLNNPMPQGLGTGQLFENNITSPLTLKGEQLFFDPELQWELSPIT